MADPERYIQSFDFSAFQELQPATPLPGASLDIQLADIATSTNSLRNAIMDVRRSDGALKNGIVTEDSLEAGLVETLTAQTGADQVEAYATAAAASAASAATSAATLDSAIDVIEGLGFLGDWGLITETPGETLDYGSLA